MYIDSGIEYEIIRLSDRFITAITPENSIYQKSEIIIDRLDGSGTARTADTFAGKVFYEFENCKKID